MSGSSPPAITTPDRPPLPADLVNALIQLLADALVADVQQYPKLLEDQASR